MTNTPNKNTDINSIDVNAIFKAFGKNWHIISLCLTIAISLMYLFNKFVPEKYVVGSSLLLHVEERSNQANMQGEYLKANQFFGIERNFMNELVILQSTPLVFESLVDEKLYTSIYEKDKLFYKELYKTSPFQVVFDTLKPQPAEVNFYITFLGGNKFRIKAEQTEIPMYDYISHKVVSLLPELKIDNIIKIGQVITTEHFSFKILLNEQALTENIQDKKFYFKFHNLHQLAAETKGKLLVSSENEDVTVATIQLEQNDIKKGKDILNSLINNYLERNLAKKNNLAEETIRYIDFQLASISDSLSSTERRLQNFRTTNEVIDINEKARRYYERLQELESEKSNIEDTYNYYEYIDKYFSSNGDVTDLSSPSSFGISDQLLNSLIEELIEVNQQKNNLMANNQEKSPYIPQLNTRIAHLRSTITENIESIMHSTQINLKDINSRIAQVNNEIRKLPKTERQLLGINRKFELNNEIYNFLLQRRTEAEIAKAANKQEHEVISPPNFWYVSFPVGSINYTIAIFLGLIFPCGIIAIRIMLDKSVRSKKDLINITDYPVVGQIYHTGTKTQNLFTDSSNAHIAESFRRIRTNLEYFSQNNQAQVYLVTSSQSDEGKTFLSLNLARVLAHNDNKTIYLGFDMRKPDSLKKGSLKLENTLGISDYLINRATIEDIIAPQENGLLDIMVPGNIPPNPLELISSENTNNLFEYLRESYDCIVIDTPPIGFFTDAFALMKHSDINLYLVRQSVTEKGNLSENLQDVKNKNISNFGIIYNDVKLDKAKFNKYGYKTYYQQKKRKRT